MPRLANRTPCRHPQPEEHLRSVALGLTPTDESTALTEALNELADLIEARGEYYYDEVEEKRWNLGDGGRAGNCDECEEAADEGWVDMDYTYDMFDEDVDGPPGHPHDT